MIQFRSRRATSGPRRNLFLLAAATLAATVGAVPLAQAGATVSSYPYAAHGGIEDAYVTGADPGTTVSFTNAAHQVVATATADALGSFLARNLTPGTGYQSHATVGGVSRTSSITVLSTATAVPASLYTSQHLKVGINYITMRDGVSLAATLRLPPGKTLAQGPFPTVIEYSGYNVAGPASLIDSLTGKAVPNPALLPSTATIVGSFLAPELGFAVVSLQMRGTACSGGAFDLFGRDSDYDGYDAVEIVAHQSFVLHHKVGLVGISYSGISQFEVAGTRPPDLAAIAPMSPTDDLYSTGYPGGIYNNGFAASWIADRENDALPASMGGQPWAQAEIATGDTTCLNNQALHLQSQSLNSLLGPGLERTPSLYDQRSPAVWATHINVPVFVVGSLQDEQTGPQWVNLIPALAKDQYVFATVDNGLHIDSMGPATITRWLEFLEIFVAGRTTQTSAVRGAYAALKLLHPAILHSSTGTSEMPLPALRFSTSATLTSVKTAFIKSDPRVRVLFNNGAGPLGPGTLQPTAEQDYTSWPPTPGALTRLYLSTGGKLSAKGSTNSVSFLPNPANRPAVDLPSGNPWNAQPPYVWSAVTGTDGLGFLTTPFAKQTTIVGPASLDLYVKSSAIDTDLQVTVSEVRPDGHEVFVATGVARASFHTYASTSTVLHPVTQYLTSQQHNLLAGQYTLVRIAIDPIAHIFSAGTKLRIVISAPGGDRAAWTYATYPTSGLVSDTVSLGGVFASSLAFNIVANATVLPEAACGALRGEPCRSYAAAGNGG
jgi:predicted acyl esterase